MATKRKKTTAKLLGDIYMPAVMYGLSVNYGRPDKKLRDKMWAACSAAIAAGAQQRSVEAKIREGGRDADKIAKLVDSLPDTVVELTRKGWKVSGGGGGAAS